MVAVELTATGSEAFPVEETVGVDVLADTEESSEPSAESEVAGVPVTVMTEPSARNPVSVMLDVTTDPTLGDSLAELALGVAGTVVEAVGPTASLPWVLSVTDLVVLPATQTGEAAAELSTTDAEAVAEGPTASIAPMVVPIAAVEVVAETLTGSVATPESLRVVAVVAEAEGASEAMASSVDEADPFVDTDAESAVVATADPDMLT